MKLVGIAYSYGASIDTKMDLTIIVDKRQVSLVDLAFLATTYPNTLSIFLPVFIFALVADWDEIILGAKVLDWAFCGVESWDETIWGG